MDTTAGEGTLSKHTYFVNGELISFILLLVMVIVLSLLPLHFKTSHTFWAIPCSIFYLQLSIQPGWTNTEETMMWSLSTGTTWLGSSRLIFGSILHNCFHSIPTNTLNGLIWLGFFNWTSMPPHFLFLQNLAVTDVVAFVDIIFVVDFWCCYCRSQAGTTTSTTSPQGTPSMSENLSDGVWPVSFNSKIIRYVRYIQQ